MGIGEGGAGFWRWWVGWWLASLGGDVVWEEVARMLPRVGSSCSRALRNSWAVYASVVEYLFLAASRFLVAAPVAVLAHPAIWWEGKSYSLALKFAAFSLLHASSSCGFRHLEYPRIPTDQPMCRCSFFHLTYATSYPHLPFRSLERPLVLCVGSRRMPLRLRGGRRQA